MRLDRVGLGGDGEAERGRGRDAGQVYLLPLRVALQEAAVECFGVGEYRGDLLSDLLHARHGTGLGWAWPVGDGPHYGA